jgi:hypothetical protein
MTDSDGNVVLSGGAPYTGCLGDCAPAAVCEDTNFDADGNEITDGWDGCSTYIPSWCGVYDTPDFNSYEMCCICGGGSTGSTVSSVVIDSNIRNSFTFSSKEEAQNAYLIEQQRRLDNPIAFPQDNRDNDCGANALANADWNGDGLLNITDIVNIVQVILGSDLARGTVPSYIDISYDNSSVYVESDGKVAGLQIEYNGKLDIHEKYVPSDWNINYNDNTILIFSLQGTDLIESKLFNYIGDITIESVVGVGWDGLEMTANLAVVPELYTLDPAYPNPFNPITNISYGLPADGNVSINIYNIEGKIIETLHNGIQKAGNYSIQWDANVYPSGVYFVKFETQNFNKTQKLMLVK